MTATYQFSIEELTSDFLRRLKKLHPNTKVTVQIDDMDETEFLLQNPKNREVLMQSIIQAEVGNLISVNLDEIAK